MFLLSAYRAFGKTPSMKEAKFLLLLANRAEAKGDLSTAWNAVAEQGLQWLIRELLSGVWAGANGCLVGPTSRAESQPCVRRASSSARGSEGCPAPRSRNASARL